MKKLFLILLTCAALGVTPVMASPDGGNVAQRIENVASVAGGTAHITFYAGSVDAVFSVYSITGQLIKTVRVSADNHASIDIPKGFYVVKCNGQWSRKVVVK
ncbi:MAG: T9SS type A sorting domain-containing protein [Muribaculaceae bacterium]|nr:T9SS type A sorting domain-containing protein [Muribaculaceae bacterium]